jgi:Fic family protein
MGSQRRTSKSAPSGGAFDSHAGDSESIRRPVTPAWPPITYEQYDWPLPPDVSMSNSAKRKIAGPYSAAVTPAISEVAVRLDATVASDAEEAANAIVRFDAEFGSRVVPFSSILLRSESTASSRIEQLTATAKAIALAELGDTSKKNATMIVSNVKAMEAAIKLSDDLSAASILAMHTALLEDEHPEWVGHWRDLQVWIGGGKFGPHNAAFVPPHAHRVPDAIQDLVRFMHRTDVSPLAHAALAHAQFETIHPFPDGNGRTGRALIHSLLRRRNVTRNVTVPISAGLLVDTDAYFASLNAYHNGDPNDIVSQTTDATFASIDNSRAMLRELDEISQEWRSRVNARADSSVWQLTELLFRQPAVNSTIVQERLHVSKQTALNSIGQLEDAGVLLKAKGEERNRAWVAIDIVTVLDRFAERSGRRTRASS